MFSNSNSALEFKGGPGKHFLGGKIPPAHARAPRNPTQNPALRAPHTDPNQAEPHKDSEPPLARSPYVARVSLSIQAVAYLPVEYSSGARNGDRYGKEAENVQRTWLCEFLL